jgi:CRP/FNR family cyclic AMP-dependent transcriptional regulator
MQDLRDAITQSYIVRGMTVDEVDALYVIMEKRAFKGGETLVRQFDKSKDLMIIMEGDARVNTFSGDTIIEMGPGNILGEIALLDDQPRSATVTSVKGTTVAFLSGDKLRTLMDTKPRIELVILRNISRTLCSKIRLANLQLEGLMSKS